LRNFEVLYTTSTEIKKGNTRRCDFAPRRRVLAAPPVTGNAPPALNPAIIPNHIPAAPSAWL